MTVTAAKSPKAGMTVTPTLENTNERGSALVGAIFILAVLGAIAMTVLGVVHSETKIAGSDLERTRTFYAAAAGIEKMTTDFSALFNRTSRPSSASLAGVAAASPPELLFEGFTIEQTISLDDVTLAAMRQTTNSLYPSVTIPNGPFAGLTASVAPYNLITTATSRTSAQVKLSRQINNYLIPIFQFGMFSNEDLEVHPGPQFTFNGRVHANGNLYFNGATTFLAKVTTANEAVVDVLRNGTPRTGTVSFQVGATNVKMTTGSVSMGPNLTGALANDRGYNPGSPNGTDNPNWKTNSVAAAQAGVPNQFGGQLLTRTTGITPLLLPLQLDGNPTRDIIKRGMPNDDPTLSISRYHNKSQIRILLDDENPGALDSSGIPAGKGVALSQFDPTPLPAGDPLAGGGRALWRIADDSTYTDNSGSCVHQGNSAGPQADVVRSARSVSVNSANGITIPAGAGLSGRILIEIVGPDGLARDITAEILSMGMTEGEPNGIVYLQRPLWAAFTQGSRDASGGSNNLADILNNTNIAADGEIEVSAGIPLQDANGYLKDLQEEAGAEPWRKDAPAVAGDWNSIVPINIYNVREGRISFLLNGNTVYERGVMSVVELNMKNLSRWLDGVYDNNLLAGTNAVSGNINGAEGYIVYISDRRGDKIKTEMDAVGAITTSNGMVDNEDIYGPNSTLDVGEDVIDAGTDVALGLPKKDSLQKDTSELPDPAELTGTSGADRQGRANAVAAWTNPNKYFRRSVRLFNGENLQVTGAPGRLSQTKGITISTENMVYIWGNFNTIGINGQPPGGSTLNDPTQAFFYLGNQIPASIVADACFPLSKTWFDSSSAMYPDDLGMRIADRNLPAPGIVTGETSVRAGIIAGNNLSAMAGNPDAGNTASGESRLNGGMHNFPRFLERWPARWNFVGSLIPLYHSTQAIGQYNADSSIYSPPRRNWAFDTTFQDPNRLPPGTPQFQFIQPTAFRQLLDVL
jgi:Tfp pilus assembly protein PilX